VQNADGAAESKIDHTASRVGARNNGEVGPSSRSNPTADANQEQHDDTIARNKLEEHSSPAEQTGHREVKPHEAVVPHITPQVNGNRGTRATTGLPRSDSNSSNDGELDEDLDAELKRLGLSIPSAAAPALDGQPSAGTTDPSAVATDVPVVHSRADDAPVVAPSHSAEAGPGVPQHHDGDGRVGKTQVVRDEAEVSGVSMSRKPGEEPDPGNEARPDMGWQDAPLSKAGSPRSTIPDFVLSDHIFELADTPADVICRLVANPLPAIVRFREHLRQASTSTSAEGKAANTTIEDQGILHAFRLLTGQEESISIAHFVHHLRASGKTWRDFTADELFGLAVEIHAFARNDAPCGSLDFRTVCSFYDARKPGLARARGDARQETPRSAKARRRGSNLRETPKSEAQEKFVQCVRRHARTKDMAKGEPRALIPRLLQLAEHAISPTSAIASSTLSENALLVDAQALCEMFRECGFSIHGLEPNLLHASEPAKGNDGCLGGIPQQGSKPKNGYADTAAPTRALRASKCVEERPVTREMELAEPTILQLRQDISCMEEHIALYSDRLTQARALLKCLEEQHQRAEDLSAPAYRLEYSLAENDMNPQVGHAAPLNQRGNPSTPVNPPRPNESRPLWSASSIHSMSHFPSSNLKFSARRRHDAPQRVECFDGPNEANGFVDRGPPAQEKTKSFSADQKRIIKCPRYGNKSARRRSFDPKTNTLKRAERQRPIAFTDRVIDNDTLKFNRRVFKMFEG